MDTRTSDGRRRWRQWTEEQAKAAFAELAQSGESMARFVRRKGISEQRLRYWRKRLRETAAPAFVALPLTTGTCNQIEIVSAGVTVRVREDLDVERLGELVELVAQRVR